MSTKRWASTITAILAGVALTAGTAAADEETYDSAFADDDADVYGFYDAGYDDINENDDWFFDHYEYDTELGADLSTVGDYEDEYDYNYEYEWGDSDATDLGGDDAGDEGVFDL